MTEDLISIDGVGDAIAEQLRDAGYETVAAVESATVDELADVHMLGESSAKAILGDDDGATKGKDFALDEGDHDTLTEAAETGLSKRGCARAAGVSHTALQRYLDAHDDFRASFKQARGRGEAELIEGGLHDDAVDTSMAKFLLASSYDYKKTEQREVTGEGGGPVSVDITETVVETPHSDDED